MDQEKDAFRGTMAECLADYGQELAAQRPVGSRGAKEARQPLVEFCGVTPASVLRWFTEQVPPVGSLSYKVMFFLELLGYRIIELERLNPSRKYAAELVGFSVLRPEELCKELGYNEPGNLYEALRNASELRADVSRRYWEVYLKHKPELMTKKAEARDRIQQLALSAARVRRSKRLGHKPSSRAIFTLMQALNELFEESDSEQFSSEELAGIDSSNRATLLALSTKMARITVKLARGADNAAG